MTGFDAVNGAGSGITMRPIGYVESPFGSKFGIPRQSGLTPSLQATIQLDKPYQQEGILRGLDGFTHLWLLWCFSETPQDAWSPVVRPPRLGGNVRVGVFASRSPFRPNPIGLSCVRLESIDGFRITVSGADLMDGTPILDIKPYIPYADAVPDAAGGFTTTSPWKLLHVDMPESLRSIVPAALLPGLLEVLAHDPRPSYQDDPTRIYGFLFDAWDVRFHVSGNTLTVVELLPLR